MLSNFNFPGKDTRLIRCGSSLYKITVQTNGDPNRFSEEQLLCDDDTVQKELKVAVDTVIAMTRRSKIQQFRTDHLVLIPKRKPWKGSTLLKFSQHSKLLHAHPYMLVLTVDSCQRYLSDETASKARTGKKRIADKDLFVEPAPKSLKTSSRTAQSGGRRLVATGSTPSAVSRRGNPVINDGLLSLLKEYARTPNQQAKSRKFSSEEARKIMNDIAIRLRPQSARQTSITAPFSIQMGKETKVVTHDAPVNSEEDVSISEDSEVRASPPSSHLVEESYRYDLRGRRVNSSSGRRPKEKEAQLDIAPRRRDTRRNIPKESTSALVIDGSLESDYELPKTRSMASKLSPLKKPDLKPQDSSFFSKLLTPFKRFFPQ